MTEGERCGACLWHALGLLSWTGPDAAKRCSGVAEVFFHSGEAARCCPSFARIGEGRLSTFCALSIPTQLACVLSSKRDLPALRPNPFLHILRHGVGLGCQMPLP